MTSRNPRTTEALLRALLIASGVVAVVALFIISERLPKRAEAVAEPVAVALLGPPDEPIRSEADVFRTRAGMLAIDLDGGRRRDAHPRTLRTFRTLRAFPGAPPRIPHGFTADEFRTGSCRTCHERGGFAPRFGAYVPLTPHPEMGACLQCHVGNDEVTGVPLPSLDPNARCRQCHLRSGGRVADISTDWRSAGWPALAPPFRGPPPIPHDLHFRGNCLPCHSGPAAVAEIRTTHPERANCRQCHLTVDPAAGTYARALRAEPGRAGGAP